MWSTEHEQWAASSDPHIGNASRAARGMGRCYGTLALEDAVGVKVQGGLHRVRIQQVEFRLLRSRPSLSPDKIYCVTTPPTDNPNTLRELKSPAKGVHSVRVEFVLPHFLRYQNECHYEQLLSKCCQEQGEGKHVAWPCPWTKF